VNQQALSEDIERLLVARNLRQMQVARAALQPGYYLRAASCLRDIGGTVIIGTGFPVAGTFETDGPVGAMALYQALQALGARPVIACGTSLSRALAPQYEVLELTARDLETAHTEASEQMHVLQPEALVAIECPGVAGDGRYYNMRGEDITEACCFFDAYVSQATCPTIAIGDGGNEIGMGNIAAALTGLDLKTSVTRCNELLVADVSNWGAYGLTALLAYWSQRDLLREISPVQLLQHLSIRGSVDGVTGENTLTEDGLQAAEGLQVIEQLRVLTKFSRD
jgi:hypothetical protein